MIVSRLQLAMPELQQRLDLDGSFYASNPKFEMGVRHGPKCRCSIRPLARSLKPAPARQGKRHSQWENDNSEQRCNPPQGGPCPSPPPASPSPTPSALAHGTLVSTVPSPLCARVLVHAPGLLGPGQISPQKEKATACVSRGSSYPCPPRDCATKCVTEEQIGPGPRPLHPPTNGAFGLGCPVVARPAGRSGTFLSLPSSTWLGWTRSPARQRLTRLLRYESSASQNPGDVSHLLPLPSRRPRRTRTESRITWFQDRRSALNPRLVGSSPIMRVRQRTTSSSVCGACGVRIVARRC